MKIIEGMKQIKDLSRKAEDIRKLVSANHVDYNHESPAYGTEDQQRKVVEGWLQSHSDIVKKIGELRFSLAKTNISTQVSIEIAGKHVSKSITEWISRRKDLAKLDAHVWEMLNDKGMQPFATMKQTNGEAKEVRLRRYYDPKTRDEKREEYRAEPALIDGTLEVINAVTDLIER